MTTSSYLELGLGPGTGWGWREHTRRQQQHALSVASSGSRAVAVATAPRPSSHAAIGSACCLPHLVGSAASSSTAAAASWWVCNSLPALHLHLHRQQQQQEQHQRIDHLRIRVKASSSSSSSSSTMAVGSDSVTREPATGIEFPNAATPPGASASSSSELALVGVGCREKKIAFFNVKVYGVALYVDTSSLETKAEEDSDNGAWGGEWKGKPAKELEQNESFFKALAELPVEKALKMVLARDVEGSQFWEALDEALTWRLKEAAAGPAGDEALGKLGDVVKGMALKKGTGVFLTWVQPSSLKVSIIPPGAEAAGDVTTTIDSAVLLSCLFDVYLGKHSVSPSIKASIATTFPL